MFSLTPRGIPNSSTYRIFMSDPNGSISALHDIPFAVDIEKNIYNAVVLGPRWTNAKMEISMKEPLNPIRPQCKKGKPRYIANCFPHHGYIWNYGIIPQTWKSNELVDDGTGTKGDNLPMEFIEVGDRVAQVGDVLQVKFLGAVALRSESSWRIVVIDINDPLADQINDMGDIVTNFPGLMKATLEWFKIIRIPEGKTGSPSAYAGDVRSVSYAQNIVKEYNLFWRHLILNQVNRRSISCINTTITDSPYRIHGPDATVLINEAPELGEPLPIEDIVDTWHFVELPM